MPFRILIILFFTFFLFENLKAQDTIYKKNGERIVVEMMQISGDTFLFKRNDTITKISNETLLKVKYANGNIDTFLSHERKTNLPKPFLLYGYPNLPVEIIDMDFFMNGSQLSRKEIDRMMVNQNNRTIQIKYKSLARSEKTKLFCTSASIFLLASTAYFYGLSQSSPTKNSKSISSGYYFGFGLTLATLGILGASNYYDSKTKRKELVEFYNKTYYPDSPDFEIKKNSKQ